MSGQRQPIELVLAKGGKHLTKKKRSKREKAQRLNRLPTIFPSSVSQYEKKTEREI